MEKKIDQSLFGLLIPSLPSYCQTETQPPPYPAFYSSTVRSSSPLYLPLSLSLDQSNPQPDLSLSLFRSLSSLYNQPLLSLQQNKVPFQSPVTTAYNSPFIIKHSSPPATHLLAFPESNINYPLPSSLPTTPSHSHGTPPLQENMLPSSPLSESPTRTTTTISINRILTTVVSTTFIQICRNHDNSSAFTASYSHRCETLYIGCMQISA